jgi:hypothetical protein
MKLYTAILRTGAIEYRRFKVNAARITISRVHEMDFSRDFPAVRVGLREWINGKPNYNKRGKR